MSRSWVDVSSSLKVSVFDRGSSSARARRDAICSRVKIWFGQ